MSKVLVHKAVEPDKLSMKGKKTYLALVEDLILDGTRAWVQPKYDGVYAQFVFSDGQGWEAFSRTGQKLLSVGEPILDVFYTQALPERRYMGELWLPGTQHQTINGRARKQSPQHLELKLFDSVLMGHEHSDQPYFERSEYLFEGGMVEAVKRLHLIGKVHVVDDLFDLAAGLKNRGASAYDGLILRDSAGSFIAGAGKDGEVIKIKPRAERDFRVVGTTVGVGNRAGGIGALVVDLGGGNHSEVGTGLTAKDVMEEASPVGRIATVEYLGITKDGKLREPSFKGYRFDKDEADTLDFTEQQED